jgi:hypothetical protein
MLLQSRQVQGCPVSLVLRECVLGILGVESEHEAVSGDLGKNTGGRDAEAQAVAANQGGLGLGEGAHGEPVDEHVVGFREKLGDGPPHRFVGGA